MGSKRNVENPSGGRSSDSKERSDIQSKTVKTTSLNTLINWNISKAVKNEPGIDLKAALKEAQERLEESHDVKKLVSEDARNLCCALLAWQQLGHHGTDSLFNFFQESLKEEERGQKQNEESLCTSSSYDSYRSDCNVISSRTVPGPKTSSQWGSPTKMDFSTSIGLVVKLPTEPQTLMHMSGPIKVPVNTNKCYSRGKPGNYIAKKIDIDVPLCCVDSVCMERLTSIEEEMQALRKRTLQFACRETQRNELLERSEMAWRDLDVSYQRRLRLAKEKEEEYKKKMESMLHERNRYKKACLPLANALKAASAAVFKEGEELKKLEQEMYSKACARAQLVECAAQADTQLTENQCKASQLDRNLALKEEQERRKQAALQGEMEAAQMLTHEAEYEQRSELQAQREQVAQVGKDLLEEDARTELLKTRVKDYMVEKDEIIQDLEACQTKCEGRMAALIQDLKSKNDQLEELEEQVMECECKEPVERAVQVKRTPSLAALCKCSSSQMGSCSCASIRSRLLSSLLSTLFGGLKSEMETISSQMPCHLLKCLEDKHNWDRNTDVKQNIRAYYSRLLLGELDIAIATVIENSHAQWVGECCADRRKPQVLQDSKHSLRWQEHEQEMKTHKLANELAEKMFREKAKELALQAQEELSTGGRPPCECDLDNNGQNASAVYSCLVHPYSDHLNKKKNGSLTAPCKVHWKYNIMPPFMPTRLLKKDPNVPVTALINSSRTTSKKPRRKDVKNIRPESILRNSGNVYKNDLTRRISNITTRNLKTVTNKAYPELKKGKKKIDVNGSNKVFKGPRQYSVNMCLCNHKKYLPFNKTHNNCHIESPSHNYKSCVLCRQQKSIASNILDDNSLRKSDNTSCNSYTEKCTCLNEAPSNTSIDRLVNILNKWKDNLGESQDSNIKEALNTDSLFKITHASIIDLLQELREETGEMDTKSSIKRLEKCVKIVKNSNSPHKNKNHLDKEEEFSNSIISSELQIKQSKLLISVNNLLYKCNDNEENGTSNIVNQDNMPISIKSDIESVSVENKLPLKSKKTEDKYAEINLSVKDNNPERNSEKTAVMNMIKYSDAHLQGGEKYIQCLGAILANATCKRSLTETAKQKENINKKVQYQEQNNNSIHISENKNRSIDNHKISNNQIGFKENVADVAKNSPVKTNNNCESYIQFLGVALDNANDVSKRKIKKISQRNHKKHNQDHFFEDKGNNNLGKSDNKMIKLYANRDLCKPKYTLKRKALNVVHVHNECVYPHRNVENLKDNKSIEIQNNSHDTLSHEPCICCPRSKEYNSNDLEVNAFQLLEDHLKRKFEEIRNSTSKSCCIQNADEANILGDTLLKVKQLILESVNTVTCKCTESNHTSDVSWKRACGLLQEYLKSKIEHVNCICSSAEYSRDENLVSQVLSKINSLIENDLQRLKDIWKSNDKTLDANKQESHSIHKLQYINSKTGNCDNMIISNTIDQNYMQTSKMVKSKFVNYTKNVLLPQNKSAQVLLCKLVESKSCDALKMHNKYSEVQTVDVIKTKIVTDNYINTETAYFNSSSNEDVITESIKKIENGTNIPHEIQNFGFSKDAAPFQTKDITVLPKVMSSSDNIKEKYSKRTKPFVDVQFADEKKRPYSANGEDIIEKPFMAYIGCTIDCCCDHDLGCVCTKSTLPSNTEWFKTNVIWEKNTEKQGIINNFSYIQSSIPNKTPNNADSVLDVIDDRHLKEIIQSNNRESDIRPNVQNNMYLNQYKLKVHLDDSTKRLCESEVNASEEKHIYLKKSDQTLGITHGAISTNTLTVDYSLQGISMLPKIKYHGVLKRNIHGLQKKYLIPFSISDTTLMTDPASQRSECFSTDCDCVMVPICHAKVLMENIANKLVKAECTCDSLKSVCPIHS